jgi:predicted phage-related endonuclease
MFFLILQMGFLLVIALTVGVILGWWLNKLKTKQAIADAIPSFDASQGEQFALKSQLNKCLDESATLRRDLKAAEDNLAKGIPNKESENENESDSNKGESNNLKEKFTVLMDDLQVRDDTISSLCEEIKKLKGAKEHPKC